MKTIVQWLSVTAILATAIFAAADASVPGSSAPSSAPSLKYAAANGQIGRSLLGLPEDQVVRRMGSSGSGPKDRWDRPDRPAIRLVNYDKLGTADIHLVFGYDANNLLCYVQAGGGGTRRDLFKPVMEFVLGESAAGDTVDAPRVFPQFLSQDSRTRWTFFSTGNTFVESTSDHKAQAGIARMVMATPGKKAYAMFDLLYDSDIGSGNPTVHSAMKMMDAELFYDTVLQELLRQSKQGMPASGNKHVYNMTYDQGLASVVGPEHSDQMFFVAKRLTATVTAVVRNPDLPLDLVQESVASLWRMDGADLTKDMVQLVRAGQTPPALRAVEVLGQFRDPEAIDDLLTVWAKSPKTPQYLVALKQISGKDLGDDVSAWRTWWTDSKAAVMKDYEEAQKVLFDDVDVFANQGSKTYHRHSCGQLKGQPVCMKLHEARKDCCPCSECKPAK